VVIRGVLLFCLLQLASLPYAAEGKLLTLVGGNYCPYSCDNPNSPGFANELMRLIYEPHGYKVVHVTKPWLRDVALVREGAVKGRRYHAVMALTPVDQPGLLFPARPFIQSKYCFFTLEGEGWEYKGVDSLPVRLGLVGGHDWDEDVTEYVRRSNLMFPAINNYGGNVPKRLIAQLIAGRVTAVIEGQGVMQYAAVTMGVKLRAAGCRPSLGGGLYVGFSAKLEESKRLIELYNEGYPEVVKTKAYRRLVHKYYLGGLF